jgi:3-keto-disaccharide hydrolase
MGFPGRWLMGNSGTLAAVAVGLCPVLLLGGAALAESDQARPIALFNGKNLDGLHVCLDDPSIAANQAWQADAGVLRGMGVGKGYIRTEMPYADYQMHVEWRWPQGPGNSGVVLHIVNGDQVWPKGFEIQLKADRAGDIVMFADARGREEVLGRNPGGVSTGRIERPGPSREKPVGEWNAYDITARGGTITVAVNGEEVNRVTDVVPNAGLIGLQTEGTPIEFRNWTLTPLPPAKDTNVPMATPPK